MIPASLQLCILLRCWNLHGFSFFHAQFKCRMLVPKGHHLGMNAGCFCIYKSNQNSSMILEQIFLIPECLGGVGIYLKVHSSRFLNFGPYTCEKNTWIFWTQENGSVLSFIQNIYKTITKIKNREECYFRYIPWLVFAKD